MKIWRILFLFVTPERHSIVKNSRYESFYIYLPASLCLAAAKPRERERTYMSPHTRAINVENLKHTALPSIKI
jgi:hypothetical protein